MKLPDKNFQIGNCRVKRIQSAFYQIYILINNAHFVTFLLKEKSVMYLSISSRADEIVYLSVIMYL